MYNRKNRTASAIELATAGMNELLKLSGSNDFSVARQAQREIAIALQLPLRQGILDGDIVGPLFTPITFQPGQVIEFPMDFLTPGTESEYTAYTMPNYGRIPEKNIEGDYVTVPTYDVGASIDWALKYARDARWDIVARAMAVFEAMFVRKMNSDAWRLLIATGVDRNVIVYDSAAPVGFFTKRLVSLLKTQFLRTGGNMASLNRFKCTDLWISPENMEDIRTWDLTMIDDVTRREVFVSPDDGGGLTQIFGVNLHEMTELGVSQTFQNYFTALGGSLNGSDTELGIAMDLTDRNGSAFLMPIRQKLEMFEDETLHRQRRQGYYGWQEHGFALLDSRRIMFTSN